MASQIRNQDLSQRYAQIASSEATATPQVSAHIDFGTNGHEDMLDDRHIFSTENSEYHFPNHETKSAVISDEKRVSWGVTWQGPALMLTPTCCAVALAMGHHLYYAALDNTVVNSISHQQWALRLGNAFSIAIVVCLKTSCEVAYSQYIWTVLKRKSLPLCSIDTLFSLTSNPFGFCSLKLLRSAAIAAFLALIPWSMAVAGLAPPATLTVALGNHGEIQNQIMTSVNWASSSFYNGGLPFNGPSTKLLDLAVQVAQDIKVLPNKAPFTNSSYHVQFYGPTMKCLVANSTEQESMDEYHTALAYNGYIYSSDPSGPTGFAPIFTKSSFTKFDSELWLKNLLAIFGSHGDLLQTINMAVLSAFAPYESPQLFVPDSELGFVGDLGWYHSIVMSGVDQFNNWNVSIPLPVYQATTNFFLDGAKYLNFSKIPRVSQQLWVQTSDQSLVCTLGNVSYDVDFEFVNGIQMLSRYQTSGFEPIWQNYLSPNGSDFVNRTSRIPIVDPSLSAYMSWFIAFTNLISGNLTTAISGNTQIIFQSSSKIMEYGLGGCNDIIYNWFQSNPIWSPPSFTGLLNLQHGGKDSGPVRVPRNVTITNTIFDYTAPGTCRNWTLMYAIEDLAANITISLLSDPDFTSINPNLIPITVRTIRNFYHYDQHNLLLSYGIGIFFTLLSVLFGLYSFHRNGVTHSSSFSAFVSTTRNPDLDVLSRGNSLGATPGNKEMGRVKLKFGVLAGNHNGEAEGKGEKHIGFGFEGAVTNLEKGGVYF